MRDSGLYCSNDAVQAECLKFCFMPLIRKELYKVAVLWNLHKIRPMNNAESPSGRLDMLYQDVLYCALFRAKVVAYIILERNN